MSLISDLVLPCQTLSLMLFSVDWATQQPQTGHLLELVRRMGELWH